MKKVTYVFRIEEHGCGCCASAAHTLLITDIATGNEVYFEENAPSLYTPEEVIDYVVESHNLQEHEFVVDSESEFL